MYILKVNLLHRKGSILNAPVRRAGHERNSQILMGRERLEKVLVRENERGKDEYNRNRPP